MLVDWLAAGHPLGTFWNVTLREFTAAMRGHARQLKHARDAAIIGGWIAALESRQEKLHDIAELIGWFEPKPPARPQTAQEMIGAMRGWVIATGGTLAAQNDGDTT